VLLLLHISTAVIFIRRIPRPQSAYNVLTLLSTTLFAGIAFSRSLHYSFYIWYFHMIPFLLRLAGLTIPVRFIVALALEWAWNQWQGYKQHDEFNSCATWWGSATMTLIHLFIIYRLLSHVGIKPIKPERMLG
jgi:hypothetical protein